jgi:branched-chain amino acid transport system permease protein
MTTTNGLPKTFPLRGKEHRIWQTVGYALVAFAVLWIGINMADFNISLFGKAVCFALAILGLNLTTGYGGQVSLGHSAFFGLGGYTTAYLVVGCGWSFLATIPAAALVGLLVGFVTGIPAVRVKGLYLALITLGLAIAFPTFLRMPQLQSITGGASGKPVPISWTPPSWFPFGVTARGWAFLTVASVTALMFLLASNMLRSRVGRMLRAVRDNEIGATVSGVNLTSGKTTAFAVGALYAAVAGALFVLLTPVVSPDQYSFLLAIQFITGLVLGGVSTVSGAVLGALAIVWLPYYTADAANGPNPETTFRNVLIAAAVIGAIVLAITALRNREKLMDRVKVVGPLVGVLAAATFLFPDRWQRILIGPNVIFGSLLIVFMFVAPLGIVAWIREQRVKLIRFVPALPPALLQRSTSATDTAELAGAGASTTSGGRP